MGQEETTKCKIELMPDDVLGWVFTPSPECREVLEKISEKQGPHARRYLDVRKRDQVESTKEGETPPSIP